MALLRIAAAPGVTVSLEYNAGNGRLTGLMVDNATPASFVAGVRLTDGRTFEQTFTSGVRTIPAAGGAGVTISIDAEGEAVINGIASVWFGSA